MVNLFSAFFYKLRKDLTFRITLFIGLGVSVLLTVIYLLIDLGMKQLAEGDYKFMFCTGQYLLITSLSPVQNFGIAIPINLIVFTVMEFNQGTIRNKIIAGNSKAKIYLSLYLSGLVFAFSVLIAYAGLCVALGSIIGGFDPDATTMSGICSGEFLWKLVVLTFTCYIFITTVTIFFSTLFRNIAPCIPVIIILLFAFYYFGTIVKSMDALADSNQVIKNLITVSKVANPMHSISTSLDITGKMTITNEEFFWQLGNNILYSGLFLLGGLLIFKRRDVK